MVLPLMGGRAQAKPAKRTGGVARGTADGWKEWRQCMDKAGPEKRVGVVVDEWGTWYDVEPSTNSGFLYQQNSLRDALVAGINLNLFNQYLRPGENGEHRPDHQRASGHDPERQGKADRHPHQLRFRTVCATPGRHAAALRIDLHGLHAGQRPSSGTGPPWCRGTKLAASTCATVSICVGTPGRIHAVGQASRLSLTSSGRAFPDRF